MTAGAGTVTDAGVDAAVTRQRALVRLAASRQRLQDTWLPTGSPSRAARAASGAGRLSGLWNAWRLKLADVPVVGLALEAVEQWWQHNPWRMAGQAVVGELDQTVTHWARRHPAMTVALAAAAGFAVVSARPWAWPGVADQLRPMPRRVGRWLLHQLTQAPLQPVPAVLAGLVLAGRAASPASAPAAAPAPAEEPR